MRKAVILSAACVAVLGLVACESEAQQQGSAPATIHLSHSNDPLPVYARPVTDPETGCEYLLSLKEGTYSLTIRYNRDGSVRCPGARP